MGSKLVLPNWRITVWMIAEELSIAFGGAHTIPKNDLKIRILDASPTVC